MHDLFAPPDPPNEIMAEGAVLLRGAALPFEKEVLDALSEITTVSPFRHMVTPGGFTMSVAMTNCGAAGWVTDRTGYRYDRVDPETGNTWPPMPGCFAAPAPLFLAGKVPALERAAPGFPAAFWRALLPFHFNLSPPFTRCRSALKRSPALAGSCSSPRAWLSRPRE